MFRQSFKSHATSCQLLMLRQDRLSSILDHGRLTVPTVPTHRPVPPSSHLDLPHPNLLTITLQVHQAKFFGLRTFFRSLVPSKLGRLT